MQSKNFMLEKEFRNNIVYYLQTKSKKQHDLEGKCIKVGCRRLRHQNANLDPTTNKWHYRKELTCKKHFLEIENSLNKKYKRSVKSIIWTS